MLFLLRLKLWKYMESWSPVYGGHVAGDVAAGGGVLDLDDLRAHVGEVQRAPRARAVLLEGDDADAIQGEAGALSVWSGCLDM